MNLEYELAVRTAQFAKHFLYFAKNRKMRSVKLKYENNLL